MITKYKNDLRILFFINVLLLFSTQIIAQEVSTTSSRGFENNWSIEIPIWIPGFRGDFSYGDISLDGEDGGTPPPPTPEHPIEPGEGLGGNIFKRLFSKDSILKFFYMGKISYKPKRFLFQIDGFGGAAGSGIKFNYNNKELVSAAYDFLILHIYAGWAPYQTTDFKRQRKTSIYVYTGFRFINANIFTELNEGKIKFEITPKWEELLLGISAHYYLTNWNFNFKSDIGTQTLSSTTFSYKIQFSVYYNTGRSTYIRLGWTHLTLKHDSIFQGKELIINTQLSGPNMGFSFNF